MENELYNIDQLISRFVERTASESDKNYLLSWVESSEENRDYFVHKSTLMYETSANAVIFSSHEAFNRIKNKIRVTDNCATKPSNSSSAVKSFAQIIAQKPVVYSIVSVSTIVAIGIALKLFLFGGNNVANADVKYVATDSTLIVTLDEKNIVTLNRNSSMIYEERSTDEDTLKIKIKGNAFIEANSPNVTAVSIHFVQLNAENAEFEVEESIDGVNISVFKGIVSGKNIENDESFLISENELGYFTKNSNKISLLENKNTIAWKTNLLEFSNTPLELAIPEIEKYYDVTIVFVKKELKDCLINAKLEKYGFKEVISMFEIAFDFTIFQKNGIYYIDGSPCK